MLCADAACILCLTTTDITCTIRGHAHEDRARHGAEQNGKCQDRCDACDHLARLTLLLCLFGCGGRLPCGAVGICCILLCVRGICLRIDGARVSGGRLLSLRLRGCPLCCGCRRFCHRCAFRLCRECFFCRRLYCSFRRGFCCGLCFLCFHGFCFRSFCSFCYGLCLRRGFLCPNQVLFFFIHIDFSFHQTCKQG